MKYESYLDWDMVPMPHLPFHILFVLMHRYHHRIRILSLFYMMFHSYHEVYLFHYQKTSQGWTMVEAFLQPEQLNRLDILRNLSSANERYFTTRKTLNCLCVRHTYWYSMASFSSIFLCQCNIKFGSLCCVIEIDAHRNCCAPSTWRD